MKRVLLLVVCLSLLSSSTAFARDHFYYVFSCEDNGRTTWSLEQHELLSSQTSFSYNNRDCDKVCIHLYGNGYNDITGTSLKRYSGDLAYYNGNIRQLSNYGAHDHRYSSGQWGYCWADWTNDYWATYYNGSTKVLRKTVVSFYDADGSYHSLSLVPKATVY